MTDNKEEKEAPAKKAEPKKKDAKTLKIEALSRELERERDMVDSLSEDLEKLEAKLADVKPTLDEETLQDLQKLLLHLYRNTDNVPDRVEYKRLRDKVLEAF